MGEKELLERATLVLKKEPKLLQLDARGKVVFVGDTHGDVDASEQVIRAYHKKPYRIVFLGDYVDRGEYSRENIHFLLQAKIDHPQEIFLLAGNHEGHSAKEFYPANFWSSLSMEEKKRYGFLFSRLPLSATTDNGILVLHGALPELKSLQEFDQIGWGDANWDRTVWGDFVEIAADVLEDWGGRPQFGRSYFERMMKRFGKKVLIRSHQPHAPPLMFERRCITIFTSHAYPMSRTIVIADLEKEIETADDLAIEKI